MGAPKRKHPETTLVLPRGSREEREAAEMRADVETYDKAMVAWDADGRQTVPLAEVKRRFGLK